MHVYASLAEFKDYSQQNGSAVRVSTADDAVMLTALDSVSRRIDWWCRRGSGFGPVTATRKYDGKGGTELAFGADLATATPTVTVRPSTGAAGTTPVVETDFYLVRGDGTYGDPPYASMVFHSGKAFGTGRRVTEVAGTWGYPVTLRPLAVTTAEALTTTDTVIDVSALTGISPGMTLLLDSEQVYVTATTAGVPNTITVDRGVNGTTAAAHLTGITPQRYVYTPEVADACKRVALRRWRARDAGADGFDGGGQVGVIAPREGEDLILARSIGHLRIVTVA